MNRNHEQLLQSLGSVLCLLGLHQANPTDRGPSVGTAVCTSTNC